jgi:hypothetical protein
LETQVLLGALEKKAEKVFLEILVLPVESVNLVKLDLQEKRE